MEWFCVKAGEGYVGIEAQYVHRVVEDVAVTSVPLMPSCYVGLLYYRGELFDAVDIGVLLGWKSGGEESRNPRLVLLKWSHRKLAVLPEEVLGLFWIQDGQGKDPIHTVAGRAIHLITPEHLWGLLTKLSYGFQKV